MFFLTISSLFPDDYCTYIYEATTSPQSYHLSAQRGNSICIVSHIFRTIYSVGSIPPNSNVRYSMIDDGEQNISSEGPISCQNTFFFGVNEQSMAKYTLSEAGDITFSFVGLGETYCQTKVFVSNEVERSAYTASFQLQEQQCFFFATYGNQEISFSSTSLLQQDLMNYHCGNNQIFQGSSSSSIISCNQPENPPFISINTTNQEISRFGDFIYQTNTEYFPYCPSRIARNITPTPTPDPESSRLSPGAIAAIAVSGVILIVISIIAIIYLDRKRKMKVEAKHEPAFSPFPTQD